MYEKHQILPSERRETRQCFIFSPKKMNQLFRLFWYIDSSNQNDLHHLTNHWSSFWFKLIRLWSVFFFKKILLSVQSRSLSNVEMLLHRAPHALSALAQTAVWKSVSNKFGAGLACDHEPRRSHDCHSAPGLPQQPRQICTGFTALTTSAARTNYRTVSGTCRNKALTQKGCLVSAGLYYLFIFLSPS